MSTLEEPFCIRGKHPGKFWHGYEERGYLPPIEPFIEPEPLEKEMVYTDNSQQLRAQITYLQKKLIEHINLHSKKKDTNDYY